MSSLTFDSLLHIYRHTTFTDSGNGLLTIADARILGLLQQLEENPADARAANLVPICELDSITVGSKVELVVGPPKNSLGVLAFDIDELLKAPRACVQEPNRYYLVKLRYSNDERYSPLEIERYKNVCALVSLLECAAAFLDRDNQQIIFVDNGKFILPVEYDAVSLEELDDDSLKYLLGAFKDDTHREQRLSILARATKEVVGSEIPERRFRYLLINLPLLRQKFDDGYRLFASSFSYEKIRNEMEEVKIEYLAKVHKTFTDIQGHILAVPVATFVVATQMDSVIDCGKQFWKNFSVVIGAFIFLFLLCLAAGNQWHTLKAIYVDVAKKKKSLLVENAAVSQMFIDIFDQLESRIKWHRYVILIVISLAVSGLILSVISYRAMTSASWLSCIMGQF